MNGFREAGFVYVERITGTIYTIEPDVILIDLKNPTRDVRAVKRPGAMFINRSDIASIKRRSMPGSRPMAAALTWP